MKLRTPQHTQEARQAAEAPAVEQGVVTAASAMAMDIALPVAAEPSASVLADLVPEVNMPRPPLGWSEVDISDVSTTRCIVMATQGLLVGYVTWDDECSTIENIRVDQGFRRQGFGAELIRLAEAVHGGPMKDTGERTKAGEALLKSLGRKPVRLTQRMDEKSCGAMLMAWLYRNVYDRKELLKGWQELQKVDEGHPPKPQNSPWREDTSTGRDL